MTFEQLRKEFLSDSKNKELYDNIDVQFQVALNVIACRKEKNITQKKLSELTGIDRADISKIENANANSTMETLIKIANAFDKQIVIEFR